MYRKEFPAQWQIAFTGIAGVVSAMGLIVALEYWRAQPEFTELSSSETSDETPLPSEQRLLPF